MREAVTEEAGVGRVSWGVAGVQVTVDRPDRAVNGDRPVPGGLPGSVPGGTCQTGTVNRWLRVPAQPVNPAAGAAVRWPWPGYGRPRSWE
jgi:hypothetical protein